MGKDKGIKKCIIVSCFLVFIGICIFFVYWNLGNGYIKYAKRIGNSIVEKIEKYREITGRIPDSFNDLKFTPHEVWGGKGTNMKGITYWYEKTSETDYLLYFDLSVGEAIYYYSDLKIWY